MAWVANKADLATGGAFPEQWADDTDTREEHLGGLLGGTGTALKDLTAGSSIGQPVADYDSGWFASVNNTTYTKAHSLSATPSLVIIEHAAVAAPGAGDEVVLPLSDGGESVATGYDGTNVYVQTGTNNVVANARRTSAAGYLRIQAWK